MFFAVDDGAVNVLTGSESSIHDSATVDILELHPHESLALAWLHMLILDNGEQAVVEVEGHPGACVVGRNHDVTTPCRQQCRSGDADGRQPGFDGGFVDMLDHGIAVLPQEHHPQTCLISLLVELEQFPDSMAGRIRTDGQTQRLEQFDEIAFEPEHVPRCGGGGHHPDGHCLTVRDTGGKLDTVPDGVSQN